ncbi:MAG: gfo/Idh/MocA family oxidoreductase [Spirochaetaceae bacterium]|nr:MAG: gfo/Idh/MocA family oxidoreductase [Spirochaetaceae bacterium]
MAHADGMNYAPEGRPDPVVKPGEFRFAAVGLDHGHIFGMTQSLIDAGGTLSAVYADDPAQVKSFLGKFPEAKVSDSLEQILEDQSVQMVASAAIPSKRGPLGLQVLDAGKHYFSDKAPFTTTEQLASARAKVKETGLHWAVCYSERVQNEAAVHAGRLIASGAIGRVLQVLGTGPHRLSAPNRPAWFFQKKYYGGILTDIGSHQIEQFLSFSGSKSAKVLHSKVANYAHPEYPELEDFGDATLVGDTGATNYFRVDWFTPDGLRTWGDGRTIILGTEGYIELRKYIDVARDEAPDHVYLVDGSGEHHIPVHGTVGYPYFGELILDCLNGTDTAMPQDHTFLAAELCLQAQEMAIRVGD